MSLPKYIKELSKSEKILKILLLVTVIVSLLLWIIHISIDFPSNSIIIFLYPEIYVFWAALIGYSYFSMRSWKIMILNAENDIYETIAYRDKTSIKNIARVKHLKEKNVVAIIRRLIEQEKLFGIIKDELYISDRTMKPICLLCNKEILDNLVMTLCPFCKRPFHKDHIIDYLNEMEKKCPNCNQPLDLADIIK